MPCWHPSGALMQVPAQKQSAHALPSDKLTFEALERVSLFVDAGANIGIQPEERSLQAAGTAGHRPEHGSLPDHRGAQPLVCGRRQRDTVRGSAAARRGIPAAAAGEA